MNRTELSQKIIDTCLEMTKLGLNQGTAGNVSVRYKDADYPDRYAISLNEARKHCLC